MGKNTNLIKFMTECEKAIGECPQRTYAMKWRISDMKKEIKAGDWTGPKLLTRYLSDQVLWQSNYQTYLGPFARQVFDEYFKQVKEVKKNIWRALEGDQSTSNA